MTEREFRDRMEKAAYSSTLPLQAAIDAALEMAKGIGAQFDPEPVKLPRLTTVVREDGGGRDIAEVRTWEGCAHLTPIEAAEVVRRCDAWEDLWNVVDSFSVPGAALSAIRRILEGRR